MATASKDPSNEQITHNMRRFLETWGPLRKFRPPVTDRLGNRARPTLHMHCEVCGSAQTFLVQEVPSGKITWFYQRIEDPFNAEIWHYACMGCRHFGRLFFLEHGKDATGPFIRKLGQKPGWEAEVPSELKQALGTQATTFQRGMDCEKSGYGIGACAYYRRIVEDTIGDLLDRIPALLSEEERTQYMAALAEVHKTIVTQTKIQLVKDLLPQRLRPGGLNPLDVLHSELSEGLHGETDDDCLDVAAAVRGAITYLVVELARADGTAKQFTEDMRKLLEKRARNSQG